MNARQAAAASRGSRSTEPSGVSLDVVSLVRLVARRWRVTVPAMVLTLAGLGFVLQQASPVYEATGSIVLLSPPEPPDPAAVPGAPPAPAVGQSPFARYGDLAVVADILARTIDGDARRDEFEAQGITDYEVVANRIERGPVVEVTGAGATPEAAATSTEAVLAKVDAVLVEIQAAEGADPTYFVRSTSLEPPSTATAVYGSTVRAAVGALAVGGLITLALAVLAEALAHRRPWPGGAAEHDPANGARPGPASSEAPSSTPRIGLVGGVAGGLPDLSRAWRQPSLVRPHRAPPRTGRQPLADGARGRPGADPRP